MGDGGGKPIWALHTMCNRFSGYWHFTFGPFGDLLVQIMGDEDEFQSGEVQIEVENLQLLSRVIGSLLYC